MQKASAQRPGRRAPASRSSRRHQPARHRGARAIRTARWDFGLGAGFYVNATEDPGAATTACTTTWWRAPDARRGALHGERRAAISGHSMGGHGALVCALKMGRYRAVSAFAPIASQCLPWGERPSRATSARIARLLAQWDTCALIAGASERLPLLVDQGGADGFLARTAPPRALRAACTAAGHPLQLRLQRGLRPQLLLHRQLHRRSPAPTTPPRWAAEASSSPPHPALLIPRVKGSASLAVPVATFSGWISAFAWRRSYMKISRAPAGRRRDGEHRWPLRAAAPASGAASSTSMPMQRAGSSSWSRPIFWTAK